MAGSGFNDDFFQFAMNRAQSPIGDFLQSATPQAGHVDFTWNPVHTGSVNLGGAPQTGHVDLGAPKVGSVQIGGVEDLLRPLQIIQEGQARSTAQITKAKAAKEGQQPQAAPKPGQPAPPPPQPGQPVTGGVVPATGLEGISLSGLGPGQRNEFLLRAMALGQVLEQETGIPAELFAAMAANESNFGNAPGNIVGGVKALPGEPYVELDTTEVINGQRVPVRDRFRASSTAIEGMRHVAQTLQSGRYAQLYQQLQQGQITPESFITGVNAAGYATNPNWAMNEILPLMREASGHREAGQALLQSVQDSQVRRDAAVMNTTAPQGLSQYDMGLPKSIADAFCGPAAATAFAQAFGRTPTTMEAMNLAKEVGWNEGRGMAGPQSEVNLLNRMGVPARLAAPDGATIRAEVEAGRPVIIDTPGHYYQVIGYNPATDGFIMGDAVGRRAGQNGVRLQNLASLGFGAARTAILANMNFPEDARRGD